MALLTDSNILITIERRGQGLEALRRAAPGEPVAIAVITASELLVGAYRADTPVRRVHRKTYAETIISALPVLPFDLRAARIHAEIWATLAVAGQMIGPNDLLYGVLTENLREFQRVRGLIVRQPAW